MPYNSLSGMHTNSKFSLIQNNLLLTSKFLDVTRNGETLRNGPLIIVYFHYSIFVVRGGGLWKKFQNQGIVLEAGVQDGGNI
jgi:hypothetical protein